MTSSEIRAKFLKYFEDRGHKILPGSSLVPADPTVLLTLAGMLQFKPIFLGQETPRYQRVTTVQKCVRLNDIDNVGKTARHQTFFEMLGNFSFGDYFKREAIAFAWDFLTKDLNVPAEKLSVAVFDKDNEAYDIWAKEMGLPGQKIFRLDEENNFWAVGPTGPCGPCSEIYYDLGPSYGCGRPDCQPGCDCDRFLEVWNLVFIQYNRDDKGELIPLKQKGIDTGLGLERIASVLQGVSSNFETDLFVPLLEKIKQLVKADKAAPSSLRIIADHIRAIVHLVSDGVLPENTGRGYVLRRLIRRAVRFGKLLGRSEPFLYVLSQEVIAQMGEAYPVLREKQKLIVEVIRAEEENFFATLEQGLGLLAEVFNQHQADKKIPGQVIFKLHDTYGFPFELSREIAQEKDYAIDEPGFGLEMEKQRERGRAAGLAADDKKTLLARIDLAPYGQTRFDGYDKASETVKVRAVFPDEKLIVLELTPFYGESGGQVGDTGIIAWQDKKIRVLDTWLAPTGANVNLVDDATGLKKGAKVTATIDTSKRLATEIHHTATHLLHKALREVLGDQVKQAGSYVGPDKLRFDFSHFSGLSKEQLGRVELIVNQKIAEKIKVEVLQKSYQDAVKMGAMALFGEKYGDKVRILKIGNYSLELCGGTHVKSTKDIVFFKVISEAALGAGVRRIEAIAGQAAKVFIVYQAKSLRDEIDALIEKYQALQREKESLGGTKFSETGIFEIEATEIETLMAAVESQDIKKVNVFLDHLLGRLDWLKERLTKAKKEISDLKHSQASANTADLKDEAVELKGVKVLIKGFVGYEMDQLRTISDNVFNQLKSAVVVLASALPQKVVFLVRVSADLIGQGYSAKKLADILAPIVGGRGGGRDDKVEGGGKNPEKIEEALDKVRAALG